MPKTTELIINTGPTIALVAALGDLRVLESLYQRVLVPLEVSNEIRAKGSRKFAAAEFDEALWLEKWTSPLSIMPYLSNSLDLGEASVIQLALDENIQTVCIDESAGRRIARLNGLSLTGSIGVLLRAKKEGYSFSMQTAIQRMRNKGIWLSKKVVNFALKEAGE